MQSTLCPRQLAEASDPLTAPARLRSLGCQQDADPELRRVVASNPNTPFEALQRLCTSFPAEVLNNPSLALYLMEQPRGLLADSVAIQKILSCEAMPAWFFEALLGLWEPDTESYVMRSLGEWLARQPGTPPALVEKLCTCANPQARVLASQRADAPAAVLGQLVAAGSDEALVKPVKRRPPVAPEVLREVAAMGHWGAMLVASHPQAPVALLESLGLDPRPGVVAAVAANLASPPALLERLASHPSYVVRSRAASNPASPERVLRVLAQSKEHELIRVVIDHPKAPPDLLLSLARERSLTGSLAAASQSPPELLSSYVNDTSVYVRRRAARNPATPPEALEKFTHDVRYEVRLATLLHPALPPEAAERLASDRSREVRARAARWLARAARKRA